MRAFSFVPENTSIDFVGKRRFAFAFSGLLVAASLFLALVQGLNFGIDFRGGIQIQLRTEAAADIGAMRDTLSTLNLGEVSIQEFGSPRDVVINIQRQEGDEAAQAAAVTRMQEALGPGVEYRQVEFVGPKVGDELKESALYAVLFSIGAILVYIWFRFEWQYGVAAIIALTHDVVATLGLFALLQLDFNLPAVAALLTIAGYSINDTVIIFDRVRENLRKYKTTELSVVLNRSVNETLSRTVNTSGTTLLAVLALYIFGGEVISGLALALIWGILIGTYSSVYVAVPLLMRFDPRAAARAGTDEEAPSETTETA